MLTEIPVKNPIITEYDTNRVYRPRPASPAATSAAPRHQRHQQQRLRALGLRHAPQRRARRQRSRRRGRDHDQPGARGQPPAIGPAKLAYRPRTGSTPTRTAAAIPSGTLPIAPGSPATRSARRDRRSGRTEPSHRPARPKAGESHSSAVFPPGRTAHDHRSVPAKLPACHARRRGRSVPSRPGYVPSSPVREGLPLAAPSMIRGRNHPGPHPRGVRQAGAGVLNLIAARSGEPGAYAACP
jgi:hypothetical protein